jgi:hypothetical protein
LIVEAKTEVRDNDAVWRIPARSWPKPEDREREAESDSKKEIVELNDDDR